MTDSLHRTVGLPTCNAKTLLTLSAACLDCDSEQVLNYIPFASSTNILNCAVYQCDQLVQGRRRLGVCSLQASCHLFLVSSLRASSSHVTCSSRYIGEGMAASLTGLAIGIILLTLRGDRHHAQESGATAAHLQSYQLLCVSRSVTSSPNFRA